MTLNNKKIPSFIKIDDDCISIDIYYKTAKELYITFHNENIEYFSNEKSCFVQLKNFDSEINDFIDISKANLNTIATGSFLKKIPNKNYFYTLVKPGEFKTFRVNLN